MAASRCITVVLIYSVNFLSSSWATDPIDASQSAIATAYLRKFGYLRKSEQSVIHIQKGLTEFQEMAGINITGVLDRATIAAMTWSRCGCPDVAESSRRKKRYLIHSSKWHKNELTYRISKYTEDLSRPQIDSTMKQAFDAWADVTPLRFTRKASGSVDIEILFAHGAHGDGDPFDGRGGVLAHAYMPGSGGDAHFDDGELFTINVRSGTNLLQVATHEIGHSLGLLHSKVRSAVMAPFYRGYNPSFALHVDDIAGIQKIYGKPLAQTTQSADTTTTAATTTTTVTENPTSALTTTTTSESTTMPASSRGTGAEVSTRSPLNFCEGRVDAVILHAGYTYMFKGDSYARIGIYGMEKGYPRKIAADWPGLPDNINAAMAWSTTGYIYFFKGENYWAFNGRSRVFGPVPIIAGFKGLPSNIDAAFEFRSRYVYVFKGDLYYRLTPCRTAVEKRYPRSIEAWRFLPHPVQAGFTWRNRRIYFFKDGNYYRIRGNRVEGGYPRDTASVWLGCRGGRRRRDAAENTRGSTLLLTEGETARQSRLLREEGAGKVDGDGAGTSADGDDHIPRPYGNDVIDHQNAAEKNPDVQWEDVSIDSEENL